MSQQSNGLGTPPSAFWRKPDGLEDALVARDDGALHQVGVPRQVFGHTVHDQIGAELERLLEIGASQMYCPPRPARRGRARCGLIASMLYTSSRGLVGDSSQTIVVSAVTACSSATRSPKSNVLRWYPIVFEDAVQHAKRAAVHVARHDDLPARLEIRLKDGVFGRKPGSEDRRVGGAFELGEHRLEPFARRVRRPRVVKSAMLPRPDLLIRRRLKNRRRRPRRSAALTVAPRESSSLRNPSCAP